MEIYISNSSPKPIYEQITDQIKAAIISGALREGDPLPSIRFLAKELRISVITTKRPMRIWNRRASSTLCPARGALWRLKTRPCITRKPSRPWRPTCKRRWKRQSLAV